MVNTVSKELEKINDELRIRVPLKESRGIVGNNCIKASVAFIGIAPSYYGNGKEPFTGRDKNTFNTLLTFLNLSRNNVFITNCVKEMLQSKDIENNFEYFYGIYKDYLIRELEIVKPSVIILLGSLVGLHFDIPTNAKVFKKMHPAAMHYFEIPLKMYLNKFQDVKNILRNSLEAY